jgi:AmmeMemoRadiSam system protein B/AmmeMemoRadiSam system protein A
MQTTRQPAVAGSFYPAAPGQLAAAVDGFVRDARERSGAPPKAIIAPHAGYVYSGAVAGAAYAALLAAREAVERVVLLGPSHRVFVRGLATTSADEFLTPLGVIPIDRVARDDALRLPQVIVDDEAHDREHSLEVHLPFLQRVLRSFSLLPFSVGDATADEVAEVLEQVWGGDETLIVVSSDLSHYHDYETARRLDRATTSAIESLDPGGLDGESACGRVPVRGLLVCARRRGLEVETVDVRNSGDTAGGRDQVVGYGSWIFRASSFELDGEAADRALLAVARQSIESGPRAGQPLPVDPHAHPAPLREMGATFVTLTLDGRLRGCIGSLDATLPVVADVSRNAYRAAYHDPRFEPVSRLERERIQIHISLLGPPAALSFSSQEELVAQLRPGVDGLILRDGSRYATFLPDVWEQLPDSREFLAHLKQKAGLAVDYWSDTLEVSRYTTRSIG